MGKDSRIEWTHHTFNPWWGCVRVSAACDHCYAETWAKRLGEDVWGPHSDRRFFTDAHWKEPLKWNKGAAQTKTRRRVFCASMADVFENRKDLIPHQLRLLELIAQTPNLDWLLLTNESTWFVDSCRRDMSSRKMCGWARRLKIRMPSSALSSCLSSIRRPFGFFPVSHCSGQLTFASIWLAATTADVSIGSLLAANRARTRGQWIPPGPCRLRSNVPTQKCRSTSNNGGIGLRLNRSLNL